MNGQILNYDFLKKGKNLKSDCDTELISYLLNEKLKDEKNITNQKLKKTIKEIIKKLEGDFSFAVKYFDKIILYKRKNPLYLSFEKNNFYFFF